MSRKLASNVNVNGRWYGPAFGNAEAVPDDVAEQVTNPTAWEGGDEATAPPPAPSGGMGRPADTDSKADWVMWAVAHGADEVEASKATKAQLIANYGKE